MKSNKVVILKPGGVAVVGAALMSLTAVSVVSINRERNAARAETRTAVAALLPVTVAPVRLEEHDVPAPPASLKSAEGLLIDSFDRGTFFGVFRQARAGKEPDTRCSEMILKRGIYRDSPGMFLYGDYNVGANGTTYAGYWATVGEAWQVPQDWSKAKAITFLAYTSRPMPFTFSVTCNGKKYIGNGGTTKAHQWERVTIPLTSFTDGGKGIDRVETYLVNMPVGEGQFAMDDLRVIGGKR